MHLRAGLTIQTGDSLDDLLGCVACLVDLVRDVNAEI